MIVNTHLLHIKIHLDTLKLMLEFNIDKLHKKYLD